jgi:hypothetical protein
MTLKLMERTVSEVSDNEKEYRYTWSNILSSFIYEQRIEEITIFTHNSLNYKEGVKNKLIIV